MFLMHIKVFPVRICITYREFIPFDILALTCLNPLTSNYLFENSGLHTHCSVRQYTSVICHLLILIITGQWLVESKFNSWEFSKFDLLRVYIKSVRNRSPEVPANLRPVCNLMFYIMYLAINKEGTNDKKPRRKH